MDIIKKYLPEIGAVLVIVGLIIWGSVQTLRLEASRNETQKAILEHEQYKVQQQAEVYRLNMQHQEEMENVRTQANSETVQKVEDERRAGVVALNDSNRVYQREIARLRQTCNPTPASGSNDASDPIGVLAHVLTRSDAGAGIYARTADERGIALKACNAAYDALSK